MFGNLPVPNDGFPIKDWLPVPSKTIVVEPLPPKTLAFAVVSVPCKWIVPFVNVVYFVPAIDKVSDTVSVVVLVMVTVGFVAVGANSRS